jgi:hypothetical protein
MVKKLFVALLALATVLGVTVSNTGSASALGGEWLGCRIAPGTEYNFYEFCHNNKAATQYTVAFKVQNETAPSTYTWSIPSAYQDKIYSGCTSTINYCTLVARNISQDIEVSVTLTQDGASRTMTAYATVEMYCGTAYC